MVVPEEMWLHALLVAAAFVAPAMMLWMWSRLRPGVWFRKIMLLYALAFLFSGLRWAGGSVVRLGHPLAGTPGFETVWTAAGVLSAILGIYASWLMLDYLKNTAFEAVKE